jgi:hypothetical protein
MALHVLAYNLTRAMTIMGVKPLLAARHQLNVLRRKAPKRVAFSTFDRVVFAGLYRLAPRVLNVLVIVKPETVIRWHRAGFRLLPGAVR